MQIILTIDLVPIKLLTNKCFIYLIKSIVTFVWHFASINLHLCIWHTLSSRTSYSALCTWCVCVFYQYMHSLGIKPLVWCSDWTTGTQTSLIQQTHWCWCWAWAAVSERGKQSRHGIRENVKNNRGWQLIKRREQLKPQLSSKLWCTDTLNLYSSQNTHSPV